MSEAAEKFGSEIFEMVEDAQGKAFISDGLNALEDAGEVFRVVRWHLTYARRKVHLIEDFLDKYGPLFVYPSDFRSRYEEYKKEIALDQKFRIDTSK